MTDNYKEMRKHLQKLYEIKDYESAVKQARKIKEKYADDPKHYVAAYFNLSFFQAICKQIEECIETLEEGFIKKGI